MLQLTTIFFLIAFSVLAVVHYLALTLYLYWTIVWFDIPMHFLGGVVVALGVFTMRDLRVIPSRFLTPQRVVAFVCLAAIVWEVYEVLIGIPIDDTYYFDTALDVVMGLSGGYVGFFVGKRMRNL